MKKDLLKKIILIAAFLIFWREGGETTPTNITHFYSSEQKWNPETRFRFAASTQRSLGQVDLFAPLGQNDTSLFFLDLRFWRDTKTNTEGNYGLAYREIISSLEWAFGGYGFFDNRRTEHDNMFQQATFGVEAFSEFWDFRTNIYVPLSKAQKISPTRSTPSKITFRGHEEYFTSQKEISLRGIDMEMGRLVPGTSNLRFYIDGFHFQGSGARKINGGRARLEWDINDYINIEADYQYDNIRHSIPFFWITLRIHFWGKNS